MTNRPGLPPKPPKAVRSTRRSSRRKHKKTLTAEKHKKESAYERVIAVVVLRIFDYVAEKVKGDERSMEEKQRATSHSRRWEMSDRRSVGAYGGCEVTRRDDKPSGHEYSTRDRASTLSHDRPAPAYHSPQFSAYVPLQRRHSVAPGKNRKPRTHSYEEYPNARSTIRSSSAAPSQHFEAAREAAGRIERYVISGGRGGGDGIVDLHWTRTKWS